MYSFQKYFSISVRKSLAFVIPSDTTALKASGMPRLMIMRLMQLDLSHFSYSLLSLRVLLSVRKVGWSFLSARSRSMQPKTIRMFSFQSLKLVPFRTGTELRLADIEAREPK
ncbi:unnamed protein product [Musa textilis]